MVVAYIGTSKTTPTVGTITGMPSGMTVSKGTVTANELPLTVSIAANSNLGGSGPQQGALSVPVTAPVSTALIIRWSKVNTGATGSAGTPGANAVVFSLYAPDGTVFVNQAGTLAIKAAAYNGATPITTGATYAWARYQAGTWQAVPGTTDSITVKRC